MRNENKRQKFSNVLRTFGRNVYEFAPDAVNGFLYGGRNFVNFVKVNANSESSEAERRQATRDIFTKGLLPYAGYAALGIIATGVTTELIAGTIRATVTLPPLLDKIASETIGVGFLTGDIASFLWYPAKIGRRERHLEEKQKQNQRRTSLQ